MFMKPEIPTGTINPVFAGYAAQQLQEAVGGIHRVFDNLLDIAKGNDPDASCHDRIRATRVLYDRGFGKVTRNQPRTPLPESEQDPQSEDSDNQTNPTSNTPPEGGKPVLSDVEGPALSETERSRGVAKLEQKLDAALGPPQAPVRLDEPGYVSDHPEYVPDLVREAQYYVLEITNYGAELASILADIHEPDPEDTTIRPCHRITAGQMILDRVLGAVADLEQPLDHWHDPSIEPNWAYKHPAEIDSTVPLEKIIEADRAARRHVEDMRKEREKFQEEFGDREDSGPCEDCYDDDPCEYHIMAEELSATEEEVVKTARGMRNLELFGDRLYFDENGLLRLSPPQHIDDS